MEPAGAARPRAELAYQLAGALGTELRGLAARFGPGAVARLVPHVVRALELLEGAAGAEEPAAADPGSPPRGPPGPGAGPGPSPPEERRLLRQLQQVTERQRDQLRAQARELRRAAQEAEALQEQLQRVLRVNAELRAKVAAVQARLRTALQRAADAEGAAAREGAPAPAPEEPEVGAGEPRGRGQPAGCSREELGQILQERNELKATVFLLREELDYYHRELLTDQSKRRLHAMKTTVKEQRRKIKAKMLGTPAQPGSSDDDDGDDDDEASWLPPPEVDGASPPPESRIRSFFSLWYWGGSEPSVELPQAGDPTGSQRELEVEEKELPSPPAEPSGGTS